jgi:hypothetical protein
MSGQLMLSRSLSPIRCWTGKPHKVEHLQSLGSVEWLFIVATVGDEQLAADLVGSGWH